MKFERGRKKNQLLWSFILKDIASQSSVFKIKQKEKTFRRGLRFLFSEDVFCEIRLHLKHTSAGLGR